MRIRLQREDFDVGAELNLLMAGRRNTGAAVTFTGFVRDSRDGENADENGEAPIGALIIEHYPALAQKTLTEIAAQAQTRWHLDDILIVHRYGALHPSERIVLVIALARHRHEAFFGAQFVMDYLKTEAPFWKKECSAEGAHWVAARAEDDRAYAKWTIEPPDTSSKGESPDQTP